MKPILEVQSVSKKFNIHHENEPYLSLRDRLTDLVKFKSSNRNDEDFWALKNVSFNVMQGESIGIIGKNGAGKSTLLKILSKITPPTQGKIISRGRIASLLEVGTGFHPELTGRENVYLNGSILGMSKKEIDARFDEIIDFAGTEQFLDTPLKHYSSGMQLRLAFAVAAFLEPEILVIDEVLAVGDAEFQKKCLGKMEDVSSDGRTILFVSHNLDAVEKLCKTSILLSKGNLIDKGPSNQLIANYLNDSVDIRFTKTNLTTTIVLEQLSFSENVVCSGHSLQFKLGIRKTSEQDFSMSDLCLLFYNYKKQRVAIFDLRNFFKLFIIENNYMEYTGLIKNFNLIEGTYSVGLFYGFNPIQGDVYDLVNLQVKNDIDGQLVRPYDIQYRGFVELK